MTADIQRDMGDAFAGSVAIVGMAGCFPGAPDIGALWDALRNGRDCITRFTRDEMLAAGVSVEVVDNPQYVRARGILEGVDLFDADFFGMSPREAELTDPQQRLFLECAWSAMEDAGIAVGHLGARSVGVYGGAGWPSYMLHSVGLHPGIMDSEVGHQIVLGNDKDNLTLRVSYKLGLEGPSITVQSGCSSSLVAVALAYDSLLLCQCDVALAGGVSVILPQHGYQFREGGIFSPDGRCRPFDAGAHGTVLGSGVGVVVLRRLEDAIADRHHIYAVIRSAALNNDGRLKAGYTAPSAEAQAQVVRRALNLAGITPNEVSYVEAHGTGTRLGDPIEIEGLACAFRSRSPEKGACLIGSIKSNIGHLDAASGVAGLIKTALALQHREIPPTLNFSAGNPEIDWSKNLFRVCNTLLPWHTDSLPRRAGVSAFGLGGTNAHLILEEAPQPQASNPPANHPHVVVLSGKTTVAVEAQIARLAQHLDLHQDLSLADVALTLNAGRSSLKHRRAVVCHSLAELRGALNSELHNMYSGIASDPPPPIAFLFSGEGAEYKGIGRQLYTQEPTFRRHADLCLGLLQSRDNLDLRQPLFSDGPTHFFDFSLDDIRIRGLALFVVQYALAQLWMAWGIRPDALLGHGVGEIAAAVISGVLSVEEGLSLVSQSGRLECLRPNRPQIPLMSSVTTAWLTDEEALNPRHWIKPLREKVRFSDAVESLSQSAAYTFVEIGSRRLVTDPKHAMIVASLPSPGDSYSEREFVCRSLARLWIQGVDVHWGSVLENGGGRRISLPTYPFAKQSHWVGPPRVQIARERGQSDVLRDVVDAIAIAIDASGAVVDLSSSRRRRMYLDKLSGLYVSRALTALGILGNGRLSATRPDLEIHGIVAQHRQLVSDLLASLPLGENFETADSESSDDQASIKLLETCGNALQDVLRGQREPRELFDEVLADAWTGGPPHELKELYGNALRAGIVKLIDGLPRDRVVRIMEIGGGTGMATRIILPALPRERTQYIFTDISPFFLARAQREFAEYPFIDYRRLDIDESPSNQGFKDGSYDIVIAVNMLHVARNIDQALGHVHSLLGVGGVGLIWEITKTSLAFAITYGLMMPPLNDRGRSQGSPFLSGPEWVSALKSSGFKQVWVFPKNDDYDEQLFIAEAGHASYELPYLSPSARKADVAEWLFVPAWRRSPPLLDSAIPVRSDPADCILIFTDFTGLGSELAKALHADGETIIVEPGQCFDCSDRHRITIREEWQDDYTALLDVLASRKYRLRKIIYLWNLSKERWFGAESQLDGGRIIAPLLFLAQALGCRDRTGPISIIVVTVGVHDVIGDEEIHPLSALLLGPCRVIPLEYNGITCRTIDLIAPCPRFRWDASLVGQLVAELRTNSSETTIAYRGTHRWIHTIEHVKAPVSHEFPNRLRQGGVYLITGGLGTVGLAIAEFIARSVKATLLLTGRSAPDGREGCDCLSRLRALGSNIIPIQADVADYTQMKAVVDDAKVRFGPISGVIHSAGVLGDGSIQRKTLRDVSEVLKPKVDGAIVLGRIFQETHLDFFVLFSALSAFKPAFGQVSYSAANNFLEAFTRYRTRRGDPAICISWDVWRNKGMAFDARAPLALTALKEEDIAVRGITLEEGIDVFRRSLAMGLPQVLVSTTGYIANSGYDVPSIYLKRLEQVNLADSAQPRPAMRESFVAPQTEVERGIAEIWQELLGTAGIGSNDDFFQLGGDSLIGMQMISRIAARFGATITQGSLVTHRTVAAISRLVEQNLVDRISPERLDSIIREAELRSGNAD